MSRETIVVMHQGVAITYSEDSNAWEFELDGRERRAGSLQKAKEAIDAPERKKREPFQIPVYVSSYSGDKFIKATITSFCDRGAWVTCGGKRAKESLSCLFLDNEKNARLIEEYLTIKKQIYQLRTEADKKRMEMDGVTAPKE